MKIVNNWWDAIHKGASPCNVLNPSPHPKHTPPWFYIRERVFQTSPGVSQMGEGAFKNVTSFPSQSQSFSCSVYLRTCTENTVVDPEISERVPRNMKNKTLHLTAIFLWLFFTGQVEGHAPLDPGSTTETINTSVDGLTFRPMLTQHLISTTINPWQPMANLNLGKTEHLRGKNQCNCRAIWQVSWGGRIEENLACNLEGWFLQLKRVHKCAALLDGAFFLRIIIKIVAAGSDIARQFSPRGRVERCHTINNQ